MTNNKSTVEVLRGAREILSDPEHWIKGDFRQERIGELGYAYCSYGAVYAAADAYDEDGDVIDEENNASEPIRILKTIARARLGERRAPIFILNPDPLVHFNDSADTVHEEVVSLFDTAIKQAES